MEDLDLADVLAGEFYDMVKIGMEVMEDELQRHQADGRVRCIGQWTDFKTVLQIFETKPSRDKIRQIKESYISFRGCICLDQR